MKATGSNPRMFLGDKEIKGISSFSLDGGLDLKEGLTFLPETITFDGIYDPDDPKKPGDFYESIVSKMGNEFMGTIKSYDGEKRDARLRITNENGVISVEPIDKDIKEWVKGWIHREAKGTLRV